MFKTRIPEILESLKNHPEDWEYDCVFFPTLGKPYSLVYKGTYAGPFARPSVWLAGGFPFYGIYRPKEVQFSLCDKARFSSAFRKWKKWRKVNRSDVNPGITNHDRYRMFLEKTQMLKNE